MQMAQLHLKQRQYISIEVSWTAVIYKTYDTIQKCFSLPFVFFCDIVTTNL